MAGLRCAGIVLCGGRSVRMGRPKAELEFGGERLLQRVARVLSEVVQPVAVVAATDQPLPAFDNAVIVVRDERPERGPLEGMRAGFKALAGQAEAVFVAGCDAPLLSARFIERVVTSLDGYEAAVAEADGHAHPLAAAYRWGVLAKIEAMLAADRLRPTELVGECHARRLPPSAFADVDPQLLSLRSCNTPAEFEALRGLVAARNVTES